MVRMLVRCSLLCFFSSAWSQSPFNVIKNKGIPAGAAIANIHIGADNQVLISDGTDVYRILGSSQAVKIMLPPNDFSLLQLRGGNADLRLDWEKIRSSLKAYLQPEDTFTTAAANPQDGSLWIGTAESGLFQMDAKNFRLVQAFQVKNGKLLANRINLIRLDESGRIWVATDLGIFTGKGGKYELLEKDFSFSDISIAGRTIWLIGDGMAGPLNARREWLPILIPEDKKEGDLQAVCTDPLGNAWIASGILSQYLVESDSFVLYGPARDFTSQATSVLQADADGRIWVGTADKGIYVVQESEMLAVGIQTVNPISCNGMGRDAALQVQVNGGEGPYQYVWNADSIKGKTPVGLGPGTYEVTVTASDGSSRSASVVVPDTRVKVDARALTATSAPGNADAQAKVTVSGGIPPYRVSWDNGRTGMAVGGLSGGLHSVTVVDSRECVGVATYDVNENQMAIGVKLEMPVVPDCLNPNGGILELIYKGGKAPHTFRWNIPGASGPRLTNLSGGIYAVTITDSEGLSARAAVEIPMPRLMVASGNFLKPASGLGRDGSAVVRVENAVGNPTFRWEDGQQDSVATGLSSGFYRVTITDEKGCTTVHQVEVPEELVAVSATLAEEKSLTCPGGSDAVLRVIPTGGKAPFTFLWNTGSKEPVLSGLPAGSYSLTLTDNKMQSLVLNREIRGLDPLDLQLQILQPASTNQADGIARVEASGGNGGYRITWSKGDVAGDLTGLADGSYPFTVTDTKGCSLNRSLRMTETILPLHLEVVTIQRVSCADQENGALRALAKGGKPPYRFQWNRPGMLADALEAVPPGSYSVTVTDQFGESRSVNVELDSPVPLKIEVELLRPAPVNTQEGWATALVSGGEMPYSFTWSTGETTDTAFQLGPGAHIFKLTDSRGCKMNKPFVVQEDILEFKAYAVLVREIRCAGGSDGRIQLQIEGGKPPYSIRWNTPGLQGTEIEGLRKGRYAASITDFRGFEVSCSLNLEEPSQMQGVFSVERLPDLDSTNGHLSLAISGGSPPYQIGWSNGREGQVADAIAGGTQKATVRDNQDCLMELTYDLSEQIPDLIASLQVKREISCFGDQDGELAAEITGGKRPYTFQWNNAASTPSLSNLPPGKYSLTVTDSKGSQVIAERFLVDPFRLEVNTTLVRGASDGRSENGKASLLIAGGSFPYTILWDNGNNQMHAKNLNAGYHSVTVTDNHGCSDTSAADIPVRLIPGLATDSFQVEQIIQMEKLVFQADSTSMPPGIDDLLEEILQFLKDYPLMKVEFGGHTNNIASDGYADDISLKRARTIANHFIRSGIPESRISAFGYGKRNPLVSNDTPEGRRKNQRVELKIVSVR